MDKDKLSERMKQDIIKMLTNRVDDIKSRTNILNIIEFYSEFLHCPSEYNLKQKDCQDYSCKECWIYAIRTLDSQ